MGLLDKVKQSAMEAHQKQIKRANENKAKKAKIAAERGRALGDVRIGYVGGFDDRTRYKAKLCFYEHKIEYSSFGDPVQGLVIKSSNVASIEIGGQQQTSSRITATRMATVGVFALAAPKTTTTKEASVVIGLEDGRQVFFHTNSLSEFEVQKQIANAVSYYNHLRVGRQSSLPNNQTRSIVDEIEKLVKLKTCGAITQAEFNKMKADLLRQS